MATSVASGTSALGRRVGGVPPVPLLVSSSMSVVRSVQRLAVVAGVEVDVADSAGAARARWSTASVVVLDEAAAAEAVAVGLPRRPGVVVLAEDPAQAQPWREAVEVGAEHVLHLPEGEGALARLLAADPVRGGLARVVGVVGGCGGAGASVTAVALALAVERSGRRCVLVDADPGGGGLDLALGAEDTAGARWPQLGLVGDVLAPETLRAALPIAHGVSLLSVDRDDDGSLPGQAVPVVLESLARAYDAVVVDLPRSRPEVLSWFAPRCDVVLLVTTTDVRAAAASRRTLADVRRHAPVRLVARTVPGAGLDVDQVAEWLVLDLAAELAHEPGIVAGLDRGEPPGLRPRSRLARVCDGIATSVVP